MSPTTAVGAILYALLCFALADVAHAAAATDAATADDNEALGLSAPAVKLLASIDEQEFALT